MEEWKSAMHAYQAEHPGHCGLCGLPTKWCFHRNDKYRAETQPLILQRRFAECATIVEHWYLAALEGMGLSEVEQLPRPPKEQHQRLLKDWLKEKHGLKTRWQVLMDEPVV